MKYESGIYLDEIIMICSVIKSVLLSREDFDIQDLDKLD